ALQWLLGPLSDRIGRRPVLITGALIFTLACAATMFTTSMTQFLIARAIQGTSICFIATVGYVTVQEAFGQTKGIKLMAIITSIVLIAPIIGPLSGAALMHFVHWKVLFAIIAVMGFISFVGLLLAMPETVKRGAVPFSAKSVLRDFRNVFCNRLFLFGAATISLSYIPMMSWVAVSPVILIDAGGLTTSQFAWTQVPVFGAVIVANAIVARFVKDPTEPRFMWRAVPLQLVGLALLIIGNLRSPHVWLWSVLGTSLYAFGIGLIFPTLFRFTLFSNNLPKGTVSASLNMVILMVMSVSVEIGRWLWFNGGRLPFHLLAVVAGVIVVFTLAGLLNRVRQHQAAELAEER
ncbi:TPA: multidrug efflux MFS transporter MdtM, partial [Escherichia coli]|nr:multidrug efflux MFS transporter MdtM [Escherichia coli]HDD9935423.1 multidrug efflux MFS transporter MdtM [Escherichia coli]